VFAGDPFQDAPGLRDDLCADAIARDYRYREGLHELEDNSRMRGGGWRTGETVLRLENVNDAVVTDQAGAATGRASARAVAVFALGGTRVQLYIPAVAVTDAPLAVGNAVAIQTPFVHNEAALPLGPIVAAI
jgi:hypothetical protein